ncbi:hypothetical protein OBV_23420 [Oscillibacter valericigenes Sjm18-20]|nr:hypothetical protein OBV_23420 [Oscillibacter valericigenes Sjm18-20]
MISLGKRAKAHRKGPTFFPFLLHIKKIFGNMLNVFLRPFTTKSDKNRSGKKR